MSPKHVLLSITMAVILAAAIAIELHPRTWKTVAEGPSMVSTDPDLANWESRKAPHVTLDEDKREGMLADSYRSRGPSGSVDDTELNLNDAPSPAPTPAPSVAETEEAYIQDGGVASNQNRCRCKHGPPTGEPVEAPDEF